jgi:hypothetical protein
MQILVKVISVLAISLIGLIAGALVSYFVAGLVYIAIYGSGPVANSYECARGMAFGWLSLLGGALIGLCVSGYWGYRFFGLGKDIGQSN